MIAINGYLKRLATEAIVDDRFNVHFVKCYFPHKLSNS